jgi:hypothetical protein
VRVGESLIYFQLDFNCLKLYRSNVCKTVAIRLPPQMLVTKSAQRKTLSLRPPRWRILQNSLRCIPRLVSLYSFLTQNSLENLDKKAIRQWRQSHPKRYHPPSIASNATARSATRSAAPSIASHLSTRVAEGPKETTRT